MPTEPAADALNVRYALPKILRFVEGFGGLIKAVITTPHADAEVYMHGAHATSYKPLAGKPVLWMSAQSLYAPDKPIRGGVPIIFPWFGPRAGDPSSPAHGFARTREWQVESTTSHPDGAAEIVLTLGDDAKSRTIWPHPFVLHYHVRVGKTLELTLRVDNPGPGELVFEEALHTYFGIGDIHSAAVSGLEGTSYIDKVEKFAVKAQGHAPVTITGETDRVYSNTRSTCVLQDPVGGRTIDVAKENSNSIVIWNPWSAKAKAMADFGDDEWLGMICIETCNVGDARITLAPGANHEMKCVIAANS